MLGPLVILAILSICGGWIGIGDGLGKFGAFLSPVVGASSTPESSIPHLELILSGAAVLVALIGWYIAYVFYSRKPERPAQLAASMPGAYKLLANKYYVDEIYGAVIVKPLLAGSRWVLEGFVDWVVLGGIAWLLGGVAMLSGAILQRWQSGNLRSYAAWLAAGAAAVLLFALVPWWLGAHGIEFRWAGH
jgi:NADH-quinone oxidoreductase subunit L